MQNSDAFLAHVVSRMQTDIEFLVAQGVISAADGQVMSGKLPSAQQTPTPIASPAFTPTPVAPPVRREESPTPPSSQLPHAKALWPYNENGREVGDLSFRAGETIEIVEETNTDWWKGKNGRGEIGLFPSNYVQKIAPAPAPAVPSAFPGGRMVAPDPVAYTPYNPMPMAPPQSQPQDVQPPKKKFGGGFGGTMARAAAGGVGFGAGAAVGGGIVDALF